MGNAAELSRKELNRRLEHLEAAVGASHRAINLLVSDTQRLIQLAAALVVRVEGEVDPTVREWADAIIKANLNEAVPAIREVETAARNGGDEDARESTVQPGNVDATSTASTNHE